MQKMETLEQVREFFANDKYAMVSGARIEAVGDHYAKCSVKIEDMHRNAMGGVMGGIYFTLADFTFAVASNWQEPGAVSLSANIDFHSAARGEYLIAEANCVKDGRSTCFYRVDIKDEKNNLLTTVSFTGYKVKYNA